MNIACLMPTYGRRHLVENAVACFLAQDHPAENRRLLILDDLGDLRGEGLGWRIWSANRYPTLTAKYRTMAAILAERWPAWEAIALMDDDDVYGPHWLSSHAEALAGRGWSYPARVWSLYGTAPGDRPALEDSGGRFWASAAIRRDLFQTSGGFQEIARMTFDQEHLARWRSFGGEPGRPDATCTPQYVYGWGRSNHVSSRMGRPDWYERHLPMDPRVRGQGPGARGQGSACTLSRPAAPPIAPAMDDQTAGLYAMGIFGQGKQVVGGM